MYKLIIVPLLSITVLFFSLACGGSDGGTTHFNPFGLDSGILNGSSTGGSDTDSDGSGIDTIVGSLPSSGEPNHDGRILPDLPIISKPVMFNTDEADQVMAAVQMFPTNNPWNEDVSGRPVASNSDDMISAVVALRGRSTLFVNYEQAYIIIPDGQPLINVDINQYPSVSDPGPYPVPPNNPIEGYPIYNSDLDDIQRNGTGDQHALIIDPYNKKLYEFWEMSLQGTQWVAGSEATFDLTTNDLRPDGWTSADAAGLPILPALPRYDEIMRGKVEHALRITVSTSRRSYIYPATHQAGRSNSSNIPRMGERLRLKSSFDDSGFSDEAKAVTYALKKYGAFVADNGSDWFISFPSDDRLTAISSRLNQLNSIRATDLEFIQTTGADDLGR